MELTPLPQAMGKRGQKGSSHSPGAEAPGVAKAKPCAKVASKAKAAAASKVKAASKPAKQKAPKEAAPLSGDDAVLVPVKQEPGSKTTAMQRFHAWMARAKSSKDQTKQTMALNYQKLDAAGKKSFVESWSLDKQQAETWLLQTKTREQSLVKTRLTGWVTKFDIAKECNIPVDGPEMQALLKGCPSKANDNPAWEATAA